jgi:flavin-dependent dehydrogenase
VGYVIDRALFDKTLAVAARQAGALVWTGARAVEQTEHGALIRRDRHIVEVKARVLVGADGPRSTVGRWIKRENSAYIAARQVEVILPSPRVSTEIYFDPLYRGGYGWLFPKGDTANVGVGVSREMGGDPDAALAYLLARLGFGREAIIGRTGGLVPSGGEAGPLRAGSVLLVGDAAGHTHPITGAGVASAVIGGTLAGQAAAQDVLDEYELEWASFMRGPLRHALTKRRYLDEHWSDDPAQLSALLRETWVAFRAYGRRPGRERKGRGSQQAD